MGGGQNRRENDPKEEGEEGREREGGKQKKGWKSKGGKEKTEGGNTGERKGHSVESNLSGNYIIPYYDSKIVSHAFFT